jgi:hypothetical protein
VRGTCAVAAERHVQRNGGGSARLDLAVPAERRSPSIERGRGRQHTSQNGRDERRKQGGNLIMEAPSLEAAAAAAVPGVTRLRRWRR